MVWSVSALYRRFLKPARRRKPIRKTFRPRLEGLEDRVTPSNVNVTQFHYDPNLNGANLQETVLTPQNVNSTNFGKLASVTTDGYAYATTLYLANLNINGTMHNVAYVSTEHDSVYAFDIVNDPSSPTGVSITKLWQRSFITGGPGGPTTPGITTVPNGDVGTGDIVPEIGITGSPVIDTNTNTLYVVAKTKEVRADGAHYVQTLHALDVTTGADKAGTAGSYVIGDSKGDGFANQTTSIVVAGGGADSSIAGDPVNGRIAFNAFRENERSSLILLNGRVYVAWASHGDNGPYHGWVVGFNETSLQPEKVFNTSPNTRAAGIWQSQGALATDGTFLYAVTGNAFGSTTFPGFDPAHGNYGETALKLDPTGSGTAITVASYFTPNEWQTLDNNDADFGSGGLMLLPSAVGSAAHPNLGVAVGKTGKIYLLDVTPGHDMGGNVPAGQADNVVQVISAGPGGVWGTPAFYQDGPNTGIIYYHGSGVDTRAFRITNGVVTSGTFDYRSNQTFGFPGAQPIISANGGDGSTAIDWELQVDNYSTQGPATLHAYVADPSSGTTLTELYNSNQAGARDAIGSSVKFTSATETNGEVFVAQEFTFNVFGLFPAHNAVPATPTNLSGMGISASAVQLTWTNPSPNTATGIKIFRSTDNDQNFQLITTVSATATSYTDTGVISGHTYFYKIAATNQVGDSPQTDEIQASPLIAPPVLSLFNVSSANVTLQWTRPAVANDHYSVQRSQTPDFATFTTIASNIPGSQLTYTDNDPLLVSQPGTYYYRVIGFTNAAETSSATSNVVTARVGPGSATIDYNQGFPLNPFDLQGNGATEIGAESTLRLTPGHTTVETGSAFSRNEENVLSFDTDFTVRLHEGTQPSYADGFAFVIQANSPGALGQGTTGLGYAGIHNSVAITFDTYSNGFAQVGASGGGTIGLFFNGDSPAESTLQPGEVRIPLNSSVFNLNTQDTLAISISYDYNAANPGQSVLHLEILDTALMTSFVQDFHVDIPSLLGSPLNGNTIAYVGFTGSTGGPNPTTGALWEIQDIKTWRFTPNGPAAPHNLSASTSADNTSVTLTWHTTSADEAGYYVERSTSPTGGFTRIATLAAGVTTYTDSGLTNPSQYYYRVQAFNFDQQNHEQDSGYSNVVQGGTIAVFFPNGFSSSSGFTVQSTGATPPVNVFPGNPPVMQLTDGRGGEATAAWYNTQVGTGAFTTTFTLQDMPVIGAADSLNFVMQADPRGTGALGATGSGGGYSGIQNSIAIKFDLYSGGSHTPTTGLYINGQTPGQSPGGQSIPITGINLGSGDPLQVTLTYDGTGTLTEMVRDTVTGATFNQSYSINVGATIGAGAVYVGFTGGTGGETAVQQILNWTGQFSQLGPPPAALSIYNLLNGEVDLSWTPVPQADAGYQVQRSSNGGQTYQTIATLPAGATPYYADTGLAPGIYQYRVVTLTSNGASAFSNVVTANLTQTAAGVVIDHSGGFAGQTDLQLNGGAAVVNGALRLTDSGGGEARSAFEKAPVATGAFTTTFTLRDTGTADNLDFVIQNDPRGLTAVGGGGGGGGYAGITNSIAIKFDLYSGGTHTPTTGLYINGTSPGEAPNGTTSFALTDSNGMTINLGGGDPIQVTLTYDGTSTLTETVTDTVTGQMFTHTYSNLPMTLAQVIGGPQAYAGFTGGTGGETSTQDILNWTYSFSTAVNFQNGFAGSTGTGSIAANGSATVNGTALQLTDGGGSEAGSAFYRTPVPVESFNTTFTLKDQPVNGAADSVSFVLQADPRGTAALGAGGGGGGYSGITHSIAVKFDLYTHGTHNPSTGLFINGQSPDSSTAQDVPLTGINLGSGDPIQVTLTYDGTNLVETVTDMTTGAMFSHTYTINLVQTIGSFTAYAGFTGGTGGETAIQSILSWTGSFMGSTGAPAAPTNLYADPYSNPGTVHLTWRENSALETGFAIERSTDGTNFTQIATVGPTTTAYDDMPGAGTFYYRVRALGNNGNNSGYSNVVTAANLVPAAPTGLSAVSVTSTQVKLQWLNNAFNADGYRVERSTSPTGGFTAIGTVDGFTSAFIDSNVTPGTTYYYRVFAFNSYGDSLPSNTLQVNVSAVVTGPVLYFRFDETSGTTATDSSGFNNTGTESSGTSHVQGLFAEGLQFDGQTGQVTVNNAAILNPTSGITLSAWINATDWNGNRRILQKGLNDNQYRLLAENGVLKFDLTGVGTITASLPSTGTWHQVTGTWDGSTMKLYVDGTVVAQQAATGSIAVTADPLVIGNKPGSTEAIDHFFGIIDDVRIYNRALSASEIALLPFQQTDIGNVGAAGGATFNSSTGTYTLTGSGDDIWNNADAFHYVYEPLHGNGQIVARVTSVQETDYWAKGGVMFRNSLDANSAFVDLVATPSPDHSEASLQWRDTQGGGPGSIDLGVGSAPLPYWLRLTRNGNTFTAETSSDGVNWTVVGTHTTTMNTDIYVGIVDTAHNNGTLSTDTFTNVTVTQLP